MRSPHSVDIIARVLDVTYQRPQSWGAAPPKVEAFATDGWDIYETTRSHWQQMGDSLLVHGIQWTFSSLQHKKHHKNWNLFSWVFDDIVSQISIENQPFMWISLPGTILVMAIWGYHPQWKNPFHRKKPAKNFWGFLGDNDSWLITWILLMEEIPNNHLRCIKPCK